MSLARVCSLALVLLAGRTGFLPGTRFSVAHAPADRRRQAAPAKATGRRTASVSSSRASASPAIRSIKSTCSIWRRGETKRISPGIGKTTCAFFRPGTDEIEFASTHADPKSKQLQDDELAFRASGKERRYSWDYDERDGHLAYNEKTGAMKQLTTARGYDAEGSYSPDGQWIVFSSMRSAYDRPLDDKEKKQLDRKSEQLRRDLHHEAPTARGQTRLTNVGLRRRPVLHAGRQEDRLAPVRRAGSDRRHLDDEPRRTDQRRSPTSDR